jgi:hypothetical protein
MPRSMLSTVGPTIGTARWMGDYGSRDNLIPGGAKVDATQFKSDDAVTVVVGAAGAAIAAVSVPVAALAAPIPSGTVLYFGGAKVAQLTAAAAKGAVTLTVAPLPAALVNADTATYLGIGPKYIPSGTIVGRTYAERDALTPFGVPADTDDEFFLVAFDVSDAAKVDDIELYRPNNIVYENFLPADFAAASATIKGKIRTLYRTTIGAP